MKSIKPQPAQPEMVELVISCQDAAHYWNQNLVFQAPIQLDPLWRATVKASQRPIGGLIGPNDQVTAAKEMLEIDEAQIQLEETEKLYSLWLKATISRGQPAMAGSLTVRRCKSTTVKPSQPPVSG